MDPNHIFNLDLDKNSTVFFKHIEFKDVYKKKLVIALKDMLQIRLVEQKLAKHKKSGEIKGPVHLGAGQEAIAVGISLNLSKNDKVFGAHRSHAHLLALGSNVKKLFAEVLGKSTGHSKGMGGSMHLHDKESGFYGSVPIVSGTIPIAVGSALSAKINSQNNISVSYFGDGAVEEGVFHESLNLAKVLDCPILFVCENNLFSSHMHISNRQPFNSVSRFAIANGIRHKTIDGNNIVECINSAKEMIKASKEKSIPTFIEAITFRHYGHVDWRDDIDVGLNRSKKDLEIWKSRDPINRLLSVLIKNKVLKIQDFENFKKEMQLSIDKAWEEAIQDPFPNINETNKYLYSQY